MRHAPVLSIRRGPSGADLRRHHEDEVSIGKEAWTSVGWEYHVNGSEQASVVAVGVERGEPGG